jgi:predicted negative regulator of RcsB-dependent stress response
MEQNIEPKIEPEKKINKKNIIILVIVGLIAILILLAIWYWWAQKSVVTQEVAPSAPPSQPAVAVQPVPPKEDSVSSINQELNGIDLGNLDQEFQAIDQDLNSL